jgi:hypothetical protein
MRCIYDQKILDYYDKLKDQKLNNYLTWTGKQSTRGVSGVRQGGFRLFP